MEGCKGLAVGVKSEAGSLICSKHKEERSKGGRVLNVSLKEGGGRGDVRREVKGRVGGRGAGGCKQGGEGQGGRGLKGGERNTLLA